VLELEALVKSLQEAINQIPDNSKINEFTQVLKVYSMSLSVMISKGEKGIETPR